MPIHNFADANSMSGGKKCDFFLQNDTHTKPNQQLNEQLKRKKSQTE